MYRFLLILFFISAATYADNLNNKADLFEEGYVRDVLKDSRQNLYSNNPKSSFEGSRKDSSIGRKTNSEMLKGSVSGGEKIKWIGAILGSLNEKDFRENLQGFLKVSDKHGLDIAIVYAIGDFSEKYNNEMVNIIGRNGSISFVEELPEKYNVKLSPSWIVATHNGAYILEGVELEKYINQKGEYIEKQNLFEAQEPVMDSF